MERDEHERIEGCDRWIDVEVRLRVRDVHLDEGETR